MTRLQRTLRDTSGRWVLSGVLLFTSLAAIGCGDDETPGKVAPRRDAGHKDSGGDGDGGSDETPDGGPADRDGSVEGGSGGKAGKGGAGSGGSGGGAGSSGSSGAGSGGTGGAPSMPDPDRCKVSSDQNSWSQTVTATEASRFALTTGLTGFGVAFEAEASGCAQLGVLPVAASGAFTMPSTFLEDCPQIRDMTLLHVSQGWRLVWLDNSSSSGELHSMLLNEDMKAFMGSVRTRLTTNDQLEQRPVLASVENGAMLAFISNSMDNTQRRIASLKLDGQSTEKDVLPMSADHRPSALAMVQIGVEDLAIAWAEEQGTPGVWLQRTDLDGVPTGDRIQVADFASADMTVDLAARNVGDGGAVLYSIGDEVKFRRLSATGALLADEIKIVTGPFVGRGGSLARLGGGYAIAYRALPGGPIESPELRVTFVTKEGSVMRDAQGGLISYKLADIGEASGRVTLRVSNDGQLLVGFVDSDGTGTQLRLVRRRLDCALEE